MAIKVSGTEVISDSRALNNIASIDATTATAISDAGVGGGATYEATASGALANGDTVIVNSDGTVSVVQETGPSLGGSNTFETGVVDSGTSTVYDTVNKAVVVAFVESNYINVVAGTVSGDTITFGTPLVLYTGFIVGSDDCLNLIYEPVSGKCVAIFSDGSSSARTALVTVSGNSVSAATSSTFASGIRFIRSTLYTPDSSIVVSYEDQSDGGKIKATVMTVSGSSVSVGGATIVYSGNGSSKTGIGYDPVQDKIAVFYRASASNDGEVKVGTVSGTSLSFGSATAFETDGGNASSPSVVFDSVNEKLVVVYEENASPPNFAAKVCTISGTSISFGTEATLSGIYSGPPAAVYDVVSGKVVVAFFDYDDNQHGKYVIGTVSGTSISFSSPTTFESVSTDYFSCAYNSTDGKSIISYKGTGSDGFTRLLTPVGSTLTSENYIGISDGAYSDAATATVQVAGAVDDAQTGLTAGQAYYVQRDGTLGTTPGSPSVFAGTALSSTDLLVKV